MVTLSLFTITVVLLLISLGVLLLLLVAVLPLSVMLLRVLVTYVVAVNATVVMGLRCVFVVTVLLMLMKLCHGWRCNVAGVVVVTTMYYDVACVVVVCRGMYGVDGWNVGDGGGYVWCWCH